MTKRSTVARREEIPPELFDGMAVYVTLGENSGISHRDLAAVLDAVVRLIRKRINAAPQAVVPETAPASEGMPGDHRPAGAAPQTLSSSIGASTSPGCPAPGYAAAQGLEECGPVAYGWRSKNDGSIGDKIVPTAYVMFDKLMAKLRDDPWIKNGAAEIVPLYLHPSAIGCGCLETYPQLIHGQIAHGPGCTNPTTEYTAATEPREVMLGASLLEHTMSTFNECCSARSDVRNASGEIDKAKYDYASALEGRVRSAINELAVLSRLLYADDKYLRPGESGLGANIRGWYESACYWRKRAEEAEAKSHG